MMQLMVQLPRPGRPAASAEAPPRHKRGRSRGIGSMQQKEEQRSGSGSKQPEASAEADRPAGADGDDSRGVHIDEASSVELPCGERLAASPSTVDMMEYMLML